MVHSLLIHWFVESCPKFEIYCTKSKSLGVDFHSALFLNWILNISSSHWLFTYVHCFLSLSPSNLILSLMCCIYESVFVNCKFKISDFAHTKFMVIIWCFSTGKYLRAMDIQTVWTITTSRKTIRPSTLQIRWNIWIQMVI